MGLGCVCKSAGIGVEELICGVCRYFGIDEKELTRTNKRSAIAHQVRGLIGQITVRELSIPKAMWRGSSNKTALP